MRFSQALLLFNTEQTENQSPMKHASAQEQKLFICPLGSSQIQEYFQLWKRDLQPDGKLQKKFKSSSPPEQFFCILYLDQLVKRCHRYQIQEEAKQFEALLERLKKKQRPLQKKDMGRKENNVFSQNINDLNQHSFSERVGVDVELPKKRQHSSSQELKSDKYDFQQQLVEPNSSKEATSQRKARKRTNRDLERPLISRSSKW